MAIISDELRIELGEALSTGETELAASLTQKALKNGIEPLDLIQQVIVPTLTKVGQDFQDFVIFLP
jgi:methanogenic corrinoid protein MtbC1